MDSYDPSGYVYRASIRESIEQGFMPIVANGWSFVIDRRPKGQEREYISAADYTKYFSQRQIPIADKDHRLYEHDVSHVRSYQWMFGVEAFADLVHTAATASLAEPELCESFTKAMDGFGDSLRNIQDKLHGGIYTGYINGARTNLGRLVDLAVASSDHEELDSLQQINDLWTALGLDYYQQAATYEYSGSWESVSERSANEYYHLEDVAAAPSTYTLELGDVATRKGLINIENYDIIS